MSSEASKIPLYDKLFKTKTSYDKKRIGKLYESFLKSKKRRCINQKRFRVKSKTPLVDKSKFLYDIPDSMIFPSTSISDLITDETEKNADEFLKEFGDLLNKDNYLPEEILIQLELGHLIEKKNDSECSNAIEKNTVDVVLETDNEEIHTGNKESNINPQFSSVCHNVTRKKTTCENYNKLVHNDNSLKRKAMDILLFKSSKVKTNIFIPNEVDYKTNMFIPNEVDFKNEMDQIKVPFHPGCNHSSHKYDMKKRERGRKKKELSLSNIKSTGLSFLKTLEDTSMNFNNNLNQETSKQFSNQEGSISRSNKSIFPQGSTFSVATSDNHSKDKRDLNSNKSIFPQGGIFGVNKSSLPQRSIFPVATMSNHNEDTESLINFRSPFDFIKSHNNTLPYNENDSIVQTSTQNSNDFLDNIKRCANPVTNQDEHLRENHFPPSNDNSRNINERIEKTDNIVTQHRFNFDFSNSSLQEILKNFVNNVATNICNQNNTLQNVFVPNTLIKNEPIDEDDLPSHNAPDCNVENPKLSIRRPDQLNSLEILECTPNRTEPSNVIFKSILSNSIQENNAIQEQEHLDIIKNMIIESNNKIKSILLNQDLFLNQFFSETHNDEMKNIIMNYISEHNEYSNSNNCISNHNCNTLKQISEIIHNEFNNSDEKIDLIKSKFGL